MAKSASIDKNLFTFNYILLAEASNHSRHPRSSLHDLRAILRPTDPTDREPDNHVSHWWEAQLLHYGLRPSKAKAVAKTRLLDALNQGTLAVPHEIVKLEAELKKQWAKKERQAKNTMTTTTTATKGTKRKTQQDEVAATSAPAKRSKATPKQSGAAKPEANPAKATSTAKVNKPKDTSTKPKTSKTTATKPRTSNTTATKPKAPKATATKPKAPKATATKSKVSKDAAKHLKTDAAQRSSVSTNHPRPKQTARRSGGFLPPGRGTTILREAYDDDDVFEYFSDQDQYTHDFTDGDEDGELPPDYDTAMRDVSDQIPRQSQPLGLLNGRYEIDCPKLEDWGYSSSDFSLILTLEGGSLWGAYDFGMFEGILHVPTRPYTVNDERFHFTWRGRDTSEGVMSFGRDNVGWLEFLGGGNIRGMINCYGEAMFEGRRVSENQTRSERNAISMRNEWSGYNQQEYDRANRARWGGSGW